MVSFPYTKAQCRSDEQTIRRRLLGPIVFIPIANIEREMSDGDRRRRYRKGPVMVSTRVRPPAAKGRFFRTLEAIMGGSHRGEMVLLWSVVAAILILLVAMPVRAETRKFDDKRQQSINLPAIQSIGSDHLV